MKSSVRQLPRKAIFFYFFAGLFFIAGMFAMQWHISGISERGDIKSNGQRTTGMAVSRSQVKFNTFKGEIIGRPILGPQQGTLKKFDSIVVYYDKDNPKQFVLDQNDSPYVITMWIVVAKLTGASAIFGALGYRSQRKAARKLAD